MRRQPPLTDDSPMPWGDHRGKPMRDVPASYLLWLMQQPWIQEYRHVHAYLKTRAEELSKLTASRDEAEGEEGFMSYQDYKDYRGF